MNPLNSPTPFTISGSSPYSPSLTDLSYSYNTPTLPDKLRMWRHDALQQHLYETAIFWGDKVLSMTSDPNDVFWLAQVYFLTNQYTRAAKLLQRRHLLKSSVACRYLAAQCSIKLEKWGEALEILGEENPFKNNSGTCFTFVGGSIYCTQGSTIVGTLGVESIPKVKNTDGGVKLEASMCYLRGVIYTKQGKLDRAKECYKEALLIDVKCYEAFQALIGNHMLTDEEERKLLQSLQYNEHTTEDAQLIKLLYTTKLKKYAHEESFETAVNTLETEYKLASNSDVMFSKAETYYFKCDFKKCLEITTKILDGDSFNLACLPTHISCMYELDMKNKLFYLGHHLVDNIPNSPVSWFAVGCYYLSVTKIPEARRYFSKASTMDSNFGPAWLGFAHSFAIEGEHDQAISAYSTAARLFQGSHLPALFIGMQQLHSNNCALAEEYLQASYKICNGDPCLLNELGVVYYQSQLYDHAIEYLEEANSVCEQINATQKLLLSIWVNLGHVYRKVGRFEDALRFFNKALKLQSKLPDVIAAIGFIHYVKGELDEAIMQYHESLSIEPNNSQTIELLNCALEDAASTDFASLLPM
ncbi:ApcC hetero-tetramer Cut9-Hcn1 [Basidiobolus meristosporus CBS 931.73]|uniref:ApcC hetero-tetramer Cut9-Hcn1 n=1 Tax=Basidiobolus meristosporus CBS 931.73 TaxID=1314790 RepID=A0A1Y1YGK2_9FUNG|nr:ApcC hetero-tetramer Cut9-Hcn1 [Basidiobolus meristosporus CBS 931.73]|eukprot:ORX96886.1 ApcC hetero-tetramer Cut9-Hcn1 [Basidiobolus meristosporus CBS 931.73]